MQKKWHRLRLHLFYTSVAILLLVNKLLIRLIPFKKLIGFYANAPITVVSDEVEKSRARLIQNALNHFDKILLWKPVCFEQSLTTMVLARLFHLPATVYFGIMKTNQGEMLAHAWSQIGCFWITGYENKDEFTVVYTMYYVPDQSERKR